jgi:hypothetical protein
MAIKEYFGKSDAGQEDLEKLAEYFYSLKLLDNLKMDEKLKGECVLVGVRGSGKTAICRTIERTHQQNGIGWKLDLSDGFPVQTNNKLSAYYSSLLTVYLLSRLLNQIQKNKDKFSKDALKALPNALERFLQGASSVLKKTTFTIGTGGLGLEFDVNKLLDEGQRELSQVKIESFKDMLSPCLSERRGYIVIDDVDEIFPGSDVNFEFIEGLVIAAVKINNTFGNLLHCLVFLKSGPYSRYYEHGRNYPKYSHAASVIRWRKLELINMLGMRSRVAANKGKAGEDSWKSLEYSFDGDKDQIVKTLDYVLNRCNSGPRDMIFFCNLAKEIAGNRKITLDDFSACEGQYSRDKLYELNRDYESQYGNIAALLARIFRTKTATYAKGELQTLIQTAIFGSSEIKKDFGSMDLVRYADATGFIEKLFNFGFIGFRDNTNSDFVYMMDMQEEMIEPGNKLFHAFQHRIHPAYETYLRLDTFPPSAKKGTKKRRA